MKPSSTPSSSGDYSLYWVLTEQVATLVDWVLLQSIEEFNSDLSPDIFSSFHMILISWILNSSLSLVEKFSLRDSLVLRDLSSLSKDWAVRMSLEQGRGEDHLAPGRMLVGACGGAGGGERVAIVVGGGVSTELIGVEE